jgi:hypothetical protein
MEDQVYTINSKIGEYILRPAYKALSKIPSNTFNQLSIYDPHIVRIHIMGYTKPILSSLYRALHSSPFDIISYYPSRTGISIDDWIAPIVGAIKDESWYGNK